jgi:predicted RNA-binding Zn-ribbon protein involved in translation (DUF1610 family)
MAVEMERREGHTPHAHTATASPPRTEVALHVCPECAGELVHPTNWSPAAGRRWAVERRCPSCEWIGQGVYAQDVVDRFEEVLDLATDAMLADLQALSRANLEEEIDRFSQALGADLILPEDF